MRKYYIIVLVVIALLGVGNHFYQRSQFNGLIDQVKKDLESEKQNALKQKDTVIQSRNRIINQLTQDNEKAKADSRYWYNMAKRKSVNPNYNIDFLTAADEVARSKYKPGAADGNSNKGKND